MSLKNRIINRYTSFILLCVGLIGFLISTNPINAPVVLTLIPLVWLFLCLYVGFGFILKLASQRISSYRRHFLSVLMAGVPTVLLLLSSINQLSVRDFSLIIIFVVIMFFYVSRLRITNSY